MEKIQRGNQYRERYESAEDTCTTCNCEPFDVSTNRRVADTRRHGVWKLRRRTSTPCANVARSIAVGEGVDDGIAS